MTVEPETDFGYYIVKVGNNYYWETILVDAQSPEQAMQFVDAEYDSPRYLDRSVMQLEARIGRKVDINNERDFEMLHDYIYRAASAERVEHDDPRIRYVPLWNIIDDGITCLHWNYKG